MFGTRISTISALVILGAFGALAQPDYFPLQAGNVWVYRGSGTRGDSIMTLEITGTEVFQGRRYWRLGGLPFGDYWVRQDENGSLVSYDPAREEEQVWYAFRAAEREMYATAVPGNCCSRGVINTRAGKYGGAFGEFSNALEIGYPGVFQVGLERELFLPYVGMVYRNQATGGPTYAAYDLIYARLAGVTVVSAPELSFGLSLDGAVYVANLMPPVDPRRAVPEMIARLTLRNTAQPIGLTFPSGQDYDLVIRDENGQVVYQWSVGKPFTLAFRTETFSGEKDFVIPVRLEDGAGRPLPQGRYIAEAWLATQPRQYVASVGFEIRHVF